MSQTDINELKTPQTKQIFTRQCSRDSNILRFIKLKHFSAYLTWAVRDRLKRAHTGQSMFNAGSAVVMYR
jgi:hypothetical protein